MMGESLVARWLSARPELDSFVDSSIVVCETGERLVDD